MRRRRTLVEPVEKLVVSKIDKELGTTTLWSTSIGHGKRSTIIGNLLVIGTNLVRNASIGSAFVRLVVTSLEGCVWRSIAATTFRGLE
jgi:hypothetical protein